MRKSHKSQRKTDKHAALREARKGLVRAIADAKGRDEIEIELELLAARQDEAVAALNAQLREADPFDHDVIAAKGRKARSTREETRLRLVEAQRATPARLLALRKAGAAVSEELRKLWRGEFDQTLAAAAKALAPWCSPPTANRLAAQCDAVNELRARLNGYGCVNGLADAEAILSLADKQLG